MEMKNSKVKKKRKEENLAFCIGCRGQLGKRRNYDLPQLTAIRWSSLFNLYREEWLKCKGCRCLNDVRLFLCKSHVKRQYSGTRTLEKEQWRGQMQGCERTLKKDSILTFIVPINPIVNELCKEFLGMFEASGLPDLSLKYQYTSKC